MSQSLKIFDAGREVSITEARANLAELIDAAADGEIIHFTRRGHRVAVLAAEPLGETAQERVRELSRTIAQQHRALYDRLADA